MSLAILLPVLVVGCLQDISVKAHRSETRMLSDALKGLGNFLLVFLHLQNHTSSFSAALAFTRRSHLLTITTCAPRRVKKEFTIPAFTFEKRLYINFVPKSVVCLSVCHVSLLLHSSHDAESTRQHFCGLGPKVKCVFLLMHILPKPWM